MEESNALQSAKVQVFNDAQEHYGGTRYSTDLIITKSLRFRYPDYTTTVTPDRTGVLEFAKVGKLAKLIPGLTLQLATSQHGDYTTP
ncbi:MAG: hypothetical protein Q9182_002971 [Xanthomendoza sp. 2 TL-2023]